MHETRLSAKKAQTSAHAWLSCEKQKHDRTSSIDTPSSKGPCQVVTLMSSRRSLRRADIMGALKGGRRFSSTYFSLSVSPLPRGISGPRYTCIISKKVAPKAVQRNKIKRRFRESMRSVLKGVDQPVALVFRGKKELATASFQTMRRDVIALVDKCFETGYNTPQ